MTSVSLPDQNIWGLQNTSYNNVSIKSYIGQIPIDSRYPKNKTRCVYFCQLRKMHNNPLIKLEHTDIPVIDEYKFLGIIFDRKFSHIPHIKYLKTKTTQVQQLLRVVAHTKWGADCQMLLKLYRALVHSQLDYGSFIYRSARKSYIKKLDPIHHEGLRLVLGAFKTSPVDSLYTKAHETPLQLRSEKLALQYCIKLKSCPSNPAYDCIFQSKYKQQFEQKERTIKPFGLRMEPILKESTISLANVHKSIITQIPPWIIKKPKAILQLSELPKTKTHLSTYIEKFHTILLHHPDHQYIFTDGSKDSNKTACAVVLNKTVLKKGLPKESSIFTAEICAIDLYSWYNIKEQIYHILWLALCINIIKKIEYLRTC